MKQSTADCARLVADDGLSCDLSIEECSGCPDSAQLAVRTRDAADGHLKAGGAVVDRRVVPQTPDGPGHGLTLWQPTIRGLEAEREIAEARRRRRGPSRSVGNQLHQHRQR